MTDTLDMLGAFDVIRDTVAQTFANGGEAMVQDMRQMISVDVQYIGGSIIRSVPGEAPRRETGALYESIAKLVEVGLYGVEMAVYTEIPYSVWLQGPRFNRPHWSTLYENWQDSLPEFVAADIEARSF